jgi:hypothetical protein
VIKNVVKECKEWISVLPDIGPTSFAQAMPEEYKNPNPVQAYRDYYHTKEFASWCKGIPAPYWW